MVTSLDELKTHIWRQLPVGKRRRISGTQFSDIVDAAILEFPEQGLAACTPGDSRELALREQLLQGVKRHYCLIKGEDEHNVGSIFTLLLLNVAAAVISELVKWWWAHSFNRHLISTWKAKGARADG